MKRRRIVGITLGIIVAALAVVLILASMKPDEFRITRSAVIPASAPKIFEYVNDVHKFQEWSPWAKMDPEAKMTYEGPSAGTGAVAKWEGKKTGAGTMTVIESRPAELIRYRLDFIKPMPGTSTTEITFTPQSGGTLVTWTMFGPNTFMGKIMSVFVNCEKMMGKQF